MKTQTSPSRMSPRPRRNERGRRELGAASAGTGLGPEVRWRRAPKPDVLRPRRDEGGLAGASACGRMSRSRAGQRVRTGCLPASGMQSGPGGARVSGKRQPDGRLSLQE